MTDTKEFLKLQLNVCDIHKEQLLFMLTKVEPQLPITGNDVEKFDVTDKAIIDSIVHRFSKLQTTLGEKVFPALLESLQEDVRGKSFLDILNKLEKLRILKSVDFWDEMRDTRNDISHDYPDDAEAKAARINLCAQNSYRLMAFFDSIKDYAQQAGL